MKREIVLIIIGTIIGVIITAILQPFVQNLFYPENKKLSITILRADSRIDSIIKSDTIFKIDTIFSQKVIFKNDGPKAIEDLKIAFDIPKDYNLTKPIEFETIPEINKNIIDIDKQEVNKWNVSYINPKEALSFTFTYLDTIPNKDKKLAAVASAKNLEVIHTNKIKKEKNTFKTVSIVIIMVLVLFVLFLLSILGFIIWAFKKWGNYLTPIENSTTKNFLSS